MSQAVRFEGEFAVGDRCRLNGLGRLRSPRKGAGYCRVVGYAATSTQVRVLFDGARRPVTIHASYLELDGRYSARPMRGIRIRYPGPEF